MKIGQFAEQAGISIFTVRYYIKEGLLLPRHAGSQLNFSQKDREDMAYILRMKELHFSIGEIRSLLYLKRMTNQAEPSIINQCLTILKAKESQLEQEQKQLAWTIQTLKQEIQSVEARAQRVNQPVKGVPLRAIPLLHCPHCHKQLNITDAAITAGSIKTGILSCDCGYKAEIHNGIVATPNIYTGTHDTPDLELKLYHETGAEWDSNAPRCGEYMLDAIHKLDLQGKVIFEANINGFFFTFNFMEELPKNCSYIIVDKYESVLARYKVLMDSLYPGVEVLYIADAGEALPLADHCIDLYVALFGEMEYEYYHKQPELHDIARQLVPNARIIGAFQSLPKDSQSRKKLQVKYPEGSSRMVNIQYLKEDYAQCGYALTPTKLGVIYKTLKHHMYTEHVDGEPITLYGYTAAQKT